MASASLIPAQQQSTSLIAGFVRFDGIQDAIKFAEFIASSELVPKAYQRKPADIVIAMQMGMELGFSPLQALQAIAVINGKPGIYGDGVPALIIGQPECEDFHEQEPEGDEPDKWVAICTIKRKGKSPVVRRFSTADAKKAGLWGKSGPWSSYPKRMLQMRARGFASRDAFPDKLKGIKTVEELQDYPEPDTSTFAEPKRIGASSTVPDAAAGPAPTAPPADAAAADAPAPPAAASAAVTAPPPAPVSSDLVMRGLFVTNTAMSKDAKGDLYHVETSEGPFLTRDESLYRKLAVLEGSDHPVTITFRQAKDRKQQTVRAVVDVAIEDAPDAEGAAS